MNVLRLSEFNKIHSIKTQGSGKIFIGTLNGKEYYIKEVAKYMPWDANTNEFGVYHYELAINELLVSKIYNEVYHIPAIELFIVCNDTAHKMQKFLIASKALVIDSCQTSTLDCNKLYNNSFAYTVEPFLVDCILANWDVAADGNIGVVKQNRKKIAFRLDVGGALKYRALGAPRTSYQAVPMEHSSMLSPQNISSKLFTKINSQQVDDMFSILQHADLSKLQVIKKYIISGMKRLAVLSSDDMRRVKAVFDTLPIMKKRHSYYIKNKTVVMQMILPAQNKNKNKSFA
jgi:hypothetical protein